MLGDSGRNFAAGMSGGIAYVYDEHATSARGCNLTAVDIEPIAPELGLADGIGRPRQRSASVEDSGMGDPLRWVTLSGCSILVERHLLFTGSVRYAARTAGRLGKRTRPFRQGGAATSAARWWICGHEAAKTVAAEK